MSDVSSLAAAMQAQQSQLAERILSQLGGQQSDSNPPAESASASRKKLSAPPSQVQPVRRGNAGVGAELSGQQASGATMVDPRLKGRLTKRKHTDDTDVAARAVRQKHAVPPEEEEPSRDQMVAAARREKKKDVFAVAAQKVPKPTISPSNPEDSALSKAQRKKLRRKQRLSTHSEPSAQSSKPPSGSIEETSPELQPDTPAPLIDSMNSESAHKLPPSSSPPQPKRTKLQEQMSASLAGARFRSINEALYTSTTKEALKLMQDDPDTMAEYHEGFASQTKKWPVNPVLRIATRLRQMSGAAGPKAKGKKPASGLLVADLGAGTAPLARELAHDTSTNVLSYDLLDSEDGMVVGCDVGTRIPLPGRRGTVSQRAEATRKGLTPQDAGVVDVAVFCLSLMGTNWVDMLIEARRVLKPQ